MSLRRGCQLLLIFAVVALAGRAVALDPAIARLERGPLPSIHPPEVRVFVLPNGMRCFLLPEHTVPVVKVQLIVRAGGIYDPPEQAGLAALAGMLLRSGGAGDREPAAFDAAVDALGAHVSAEMGLEMGALSLEVLAPDLEAGLGLLFDMAFAPRLEERRLSVARANLLEALRREDDDPEELVSYRYAQFVYGQASPWARRPTAETVARVGRDEIRALHERFFKAGNILLAAAGDFDEGALLALVKRMTANAPRGKADLPAVPEVALAFEPGREQIRRPTTQAYVRMGHLGIRRQNPDKFALLVLDEILGGGFKSRLLEDIRTRRGLVYSVWSSVTPGTDYGLFTVGLATKSDQAAEAIELARRHIERLAEGGDLTAAEVAFAKRSIVSRLVFEFDRAAKVVQARARFFFYGYPDNYWRIYRDRILATTNADLTRVGAAYLHPEGLRTVIVGPASAAPEEAKGAGAPQRSDEGEKGAGP